MWRDITLRLKQAAPGDGEKMNLIVDIIGYIGAAFIGAVCLELFWYERRRRQNRREELEVPDLPDLPDLPEQNYCGYCGRKFRQDEDGGWFPCDCAMDWAASLYEDDNPPHTGEKEK